MATEKAQTESREDSRREKGMQSFVYVGQGENDPAPHETFKAVSASGKTYDFTRGKPLDVDAQLAKKLENNSHFVRAEDYKPKRGPGRPAKGSGVEGVRSAAEADDDEFLGTKEG